jgi:hypothetical protein
MPARYIINQDLNMALYICEGRLRGSELLDTALEVISDPRRKMGMVSIIDMIGVQEEFDIEDLRQVVKIVHDMSHGWTTQPTRIAVLTYSKGVSLLAEAVMSMSVGRMDIRSFGGICDAAKWLGLDNLKNEALRIWMDARNLQGPAECL